mmetsp:Transcript_35467/g.54262  ORF Transcript_35467/g.54262 Transcript_35467/m.54262 type:complete len:91 (-) Transcript_35467:223-495(-)
MKHPQQHFTQNKAKAASAGAQSTKDSSEEMVGTGGSPDVKNYNMPSLQDFLRGPAPGFQTKVGEAALRMALNKNDPLSCQLVVKASNLLR